MSLGHLAKCSPRPITTTDVLFNNSLKDEIPKDKQTQEGFGFTRCDDRNEESHPFGLRRGFLLFLKDDEISPINPIKLNEWQRSGCLTKKIIEKFSRFPGESRGDYFPYFLRNQHVLDLSTPPAQLDGQDNPLLKAIDAVKLCLEPEDRGKDLRSLEPPRTHYCFTLYAMALGS